MSEKEKEMANFFRKKKRQVRGSVASKFMTMGTLPIDYNDVISDFAQTQKKTPSAIKNDMLSPAVQRELKNKEVWYVC